MRLSELKLTKRIGAYMKVYSIVAYDNANDEPPRVSVFSSEDAAVQSVVDEVTGFASLHEAGGDFSLADPSETMLASPTMLLVE